MKYYVASRSANREQAIRVARALEDKGNAITFAWFDADGSLKKPYRKTGDLSTREHAEKSIVGASSADAFVLISEPGMRGTYIEMGAYIGARISRNEPVFFHLVGLNEEEHVFESFEEASFYESVDEFIKSL